MRIRSHSMSETMVDPPRSSQEAELPVPLKRSASLSAIKKSPNKSFSRGRILDKMPLELMDKIAFSLPLEDRLNFAKTCKNLYYRYSTGGEYVPFLPENMLDTSAFVDMELLDESELNKQIKISFGRLNNFKFFFKSIEKKRTIKFDGVEFEKARFSRENTKEMKSGIIFFLEKMKFSELTNSLNTRKKERMFRESVQQIRLPRNVNGA